MDSTGRDRLKARRDEDIFAGFLVEATSDVVRDGFAQGRRDGVVLEAEAREKLPDECILESAGHREAVKGGEVTKTNAVKMARKSSDYNRASYPSTIRTS